MTYDTILSDEERDALASDLEGADWHSAAADIRDGLTPETVLSRLHRLSIEDGADTGDPAAIIDAHIDKAREHHGSRRSS